MNEFIKKYFKDRQAISIGAFEKEAGLPAKVLFEFLFNHGELRGKNFERVTKTIEKYSPGIFKVLKIEELNSQKKNNE